MKNWNLLLHVSRTSWYYLILFAVAFVGDILPGAIPNASVPFGIPIAILLRWLLAEWLGLQVSAQLPWWSLMELDERRSNFSSRKLSTKSNSGVPARGHLERTSLCGNWLPVASSGTKKWECWARVAMTLWSSSPKLWCFPFVHNSHCQNQKNGWFEVQTCQCSSWTPLVQKRFLHLVPPTWTERRQVLYIAMSASCESVFSVEKSF